MHNDLMNLTLKELWQLFPIELAEHNPYWKEWYKEEKSLISDILGQKNLIDHVKISHIGSTSIDGIMAKPIIDMLLEANIKDFPAIKQALVLNGYICMSEKSNRISFNKGYTINGYAKKVFHLHLRAFGDCDEIYFRDFLNAHPEAAKKYEILKISLAKKFKFDRDAYTDAKSGFVSKIINTRCS